MSIKSPETLVAIIVAAKRAGDRELERRARATLESVFGVKLTFASSWKLEGSNDA